VYSTPTVSDDTIPQITEGIEFMTLAITPASSSNKLLIQVVFNGAYDTSGSTTALLCQDTTANSLASVEHYQGTGGTQVSLTFNHFMAAGTTSSTTFRVRGGSNGASNTFTFNGLGGGRVHGGVRASSITIWEIEA